MKKSIMILGVAALALAACNKTETVINEIPGEMAFKTVSSNVTKGAELTGVIMPNTYGIYAAATQKNASSVIENPNFFTGTEQLFATTESDPTSGSDARLWHASPTNIYWPIGGVKMDFLAYAMPQADHNAIATSAAAAADWTAYWNNASHDAATLLSFNGVDTYANQVDVLYSFANEQTSAVNGGPAKSTPMTFNHAQAMLIFNVKVNEAAAEKIQIDEISYLTEDRVNAMLSDQVSVAAGNDSALEDLTDDDVTLKTVGTFTVDNSRNKLIAGWSDLAAKKENAAMPNFGAEAAVSASNIADVNATQKYAVAIPYVADDKYAQLGETLLVPEQAKANFTITYKIGDKTFYYTYNDLRGAWEKGKKYIYNLDLTLNEIVITESVVDFVDAALPAIAL